jgi:hypothetical protein
MIEQLMSRSLSGDHQGCPAGFIRLHVWGLRSFCRSSELSCCASGAVHTGANPIVWAGSNKWQASHLEAGENCTKISPT